MAHIHLHAHFGNGISHGRAYFYRNSCIDIKFNHDSVPKPIVDAFSSISGESYSDTISMVPEIKNSSISREKTLNAKFEKIKLLKSELKIIDTSIIILAISGLVFAVYDFERNYQNELDFRFNNQEFSERIRIFISISTCICILLAMVRSRVSYSIKRERKVFLEESIKDYFFSSSFIGLVIEVFVVAIHSPPYINYTFEFKQLSGVLYIDLNTICCSLMMIRLFLAFRLFLHYSKWASLKVQMVCQENSVFNPLRFALKACLKDKPHYVLIPVFGISVLALGVVMQIYERPYSFDNNLDSGFLDYSYLYNDLWLVVLTMTTVGYGDFYPRTHAGRMIAIIAAIWGTFLISLMIIMFNNFVCFNNRQQHSFKIFKKIKDFREMNTFKAQFIKAAIEIYM